MRKRIGTLLLCYLNSIISFIVGKQRSQYLIEHVISSLQISTQTFITYHQRPQSTTAVRTLSRLIENLPQLSIVIQGLIVTDSAFTLETVKLYKRHFPGAIIILSTWDHQEAQIISQFEDLGIEVLLNPMPAYAGVSNINLQIITSKNGVLRAKELGAEYVIKTRSDQRMYATDIHEYLYNLLRLFPLKNHAYKQTMRIIGISTNTFKYRLYGLSDMFTYGHIDDMIMYWDAELDSRKFTDNEMQKGMVSPRSFAHWRVCEVYLATEFLKKIERNLEWTLTDSLRVFADHFCVVDRESLDLFWGKYGFSEFRWKQYEKHINVFEEMDFKEWLNLYSNQTDYTAQEKILDMPIEN